MSVYSEALRMSLGTGSEKNRILGFVVCKVKTKTIRDYNLYKGVDRFSDDVEAMTGRKPYLWFRICWKYISPICTIVSCLKGFKV